MHLKVGEDLHAVVRDGKVVLVPCTCPREPLLPPFREEQLPEAVKVLFEIRPS